MIPNFNQKVKTSFIFLFCMIVLFSSCKKDEENGTVTDYNKGIFVVNEGPFQNGTGTITFRNDTDTIQDVFGKANPSKVLGNIAQSMIKFGDKYYITVNNANKIQIVKTSDFTSVGEINGIGLPRYFASNGTKLYVSSWGSDSKSGAIYEINSETQKLSEPINVGNAPEKMVFVGDKLYVAISSPFEGSSNTVAVIDTKTNKVTKTIIAGDSPKHLIVDKNNDIWVLCSGNFYFNTTKNTVPSLHRIKDDVSVNSYPFITEASGLTINSQGDRLYIIADGKVFAHDITDTTFENESIYDGIFYSIAFQESGNRIYLTDAKDFASVGETIFINPTTSQTGRFACGVAPGFIYFAE